jgi:hypothetical protein
MARVYLETSFFGACVSDRNDPKSIVRRDESRRWWVQQKSFHDLCISYEVVRELSAETFPHSDDALALTADVEVLDATEESRGLARILVRERVMPGPEESGDAVHLAIATVQQMDVVLSWNVKHLANRNKVAHLREICRRVGYVPPDILTPDLYWQTGE